MQDTLAKYATGDCVYSCFMGSETEFCPTKSPTVSPLQ